MNYLAHLFLAAGEKDLLVGNFIADQVKGNRYNEYPDGVAKGIIMHRSTDYFADTHPVYLRSVHRLAPLHSKFSGVITDVLYDHLLAVSWNSYSTVNLADFCSRTYSILHSGESAMPEKSRVILKYMSAANWLQSYGTIDGIERALKGLSKRLKYYHPLEEAVHTFVSDYKYFKDDFETFFPLLQEHVKPFCGAG